ncbi:hypothetical protein BGZ52_004348 [Haplosporangium bisporale]|nr:hypothetical protein BGZ52_004348 [Haplosporangium bisporale]KAF9210768.1 hypothetical protein BGZ59_008950 [Podila verticillata]KFH71307.1 hypothetical protein MVEG_01607 [Podila verticillata NRRL 6337]
MTRQRSQSTSSMGAMARSPTSIVTSLSTSVALYNSLQPPKSLQDILLLAQSHYISHRYVPALTLYKLAVEQHHSLPACCSLYALYTSTRNEPGLTRSDTKAAHILIHALRIWTARRWSSSRLFDDDAGSAMRSRTRDEHDELEEYFAPKSVSKKRSAHSKNSKMNRSAGHKNIPIRSSGSLAPPPGARSESVQSEYRNSGILGSISNEEVDEEPDIRDQQDNFYHSEDEEEEGYESYEEAFEDDCEGEDEEQAKEEEARRIGLATAEIEDIVQKLCALIQKGVLALDEPIVVEAVAMLRKIERGLSTEADVWKQQQERSQSLFSSSLSGSFGGSRRNDELSSTNPGLLLTQGVDLSFLNFSLDEEFSIAQAPVSGPSRVTSPPQTMLLPPTKQSPVNRSISNMSTLEQETDQAMCRAIRIRVMFTLGWVHQRLGEYHYGAQAYGVCSEITPKTGKRVLDSLQQEATVQKFTCRAFEKKALEQAQKKKAERKQQLQQQNRKDVQNRSNRNSPIRSPTPASTRTATSPISAKSSPSRSSIAAASSIKDQMASRASSVYNSSESASTVTNRPDISRPSSPSNSETSVMPSTQGAPISSLSAWSSGLFKLSNKPTTTPALSTSSPDKDNTNPPRLLRSKSVSHGLKINTLDALTIAVEAKDRNSNKPLVQQRPSKPVHQASAPSLTMVGHQTQVAKCGHCGQKRVLMPLCVCKKVRYCNRECRLADMEVHRKTGCHAAMIGSVAGLGVSSVDGRPSVASVTPGIAI